MTGDQEDQARRIRDLIPSWFADSNPLLDAILWGWGKAKAHVYALIMYVRLQMRVQTATDGNLDMIAADFFGDELQRYPGQSDDDYRVRIMASLLRERNTRAGIRKILLDLTGNEPIIVEPWRPADTGGYGVACGYGVAGAYGSMRLPYQAFITVERPASISDDDVYRAIAAAKPEGTIVWTRVHT